MMGITLARKLCKYLRKEVNVNIPCNLPKCLNVVKLPAINNQTKYVVLFTKDICDISYRSAYVKKLVFKKQIYDDGETVRAV